MARLEAMFITHKGASPLTFLLSGWCLLLVNTSSALSAFEKMEEKVMAMESQAEAFGQLTTDDLEGKFALLESSSVDDDLANLKKELSGGSKKGDLPPGRSGTTSTNTGNPFRDSEIELELDQLRQRAKEF
ncbi:membrane-associated 30 kDa protein, chloroplastic-like [Vigna umbellata]|uniref:membrane-associated 30 kDa protein, chloroplastic-like n=1 Tax=Vigna umbellata TaxID=87088 RepID=UPI001F5ED667|nr:membrane-associated 30 kDa protein, chloroplastic-like [Vigna umbellata]